MRISRKLGISMVPLLAVLTCAAGWATSVRLVNLAEMTEAADRVFRGRCVSVKKLADPAGGFPAVEFRFEVLEAVKGTEKGQTVVFRQVQTARRGAGGIPGIPEYRKGEDLLIFLAGDSRIGLTSPIGLGQGAFRLREGGDGDLEALNEIENRNLTVGLESAKAASMGLSSEEMATLRRGGPIPLAALVSAARKIDRSQAGSGRAER